MAAVAAAARRVEAVPPPRPLPAAETYDARQARARTRGRDGGEARKGAQPRERDDHRQQEQQERCLGKSGLGGTAAAARLSGRLSAGEGESAVNEGQEEAEDKGDETPAGAERGEGRGRLYQRPRRGAPWRERGLG